jgi:nucleotide-binding universal stress UspA family protein
MTDQDVTGTETNNPAYGTMLYVTELADESNESLDLAFQLAATHGVRLEIVHVVDLNHAQSSPDGLMGIQFRLEVLARSLRHLKKNAASILLFGSPEEVITKRAIEIKAKLIAFARQRPARTGMLKRLGNRASCPVVILPVPVIPA